VVFKVIDTVSSAKIQVDIRSNILNQECKIGRERERDTHTHAPRTHTHTHTISSSRMLRTIIYQFCFQNRKLICMGTLLIIFVTKNALFNFISNWEISVKPGTVLWLYAGCSVSKNTLHTYYFNTDIWNSKYGQVSISASNHQASRDISYLPEY
jgi:hypothetical protein